MQRRRQGGRDGGGNVGAITAATSPFRHYGPGLNVYGKVPPTSLHVEQNIEQKGKSVVPEHSALTTRPRGLSTTQCVLSTTGLEPAHLRTARQRNRPGIELREQLRVLDDVEEGFRAVPVFDYPNDFRCPSAHIWGLLTVYTVQEAPQKSIAKWTWARLPYFIKTHSSMPLSDSYDSPRALHLRVMHPVSLLSGWFGFTRSFGRVASPNVMCDDGPCPPELNLLRRLFDPHLT
jgi:hypothetical protein